jgi:RimJ/RimL family protein N-acetyltransferase
MQGRAYRIATERLILRCWHPSDAARLKAAIDASLPHLSQMPWARFEPQTLDEKIALLRSFRGKFDLGAELIYGIFDGDGDEVVGGTGLHPRVGPGAAEIGYWIHVDRVGQGLATETAAALTQVAFELEKLDRVEIHCRPDNHASAAVAKKLGYTHEATLRRRPVDGESDGGYRDMMIWTLFAADFPNTPSARVRLQAWDAADRVIALG